MKKLNPLFWAVFDERGTIWIYTVRKTRKGAIDAWLDEGGFRGETSKWNYWRRAGYAVDRISIKRI